jgi:hypothetical protein
MRSRRKARFQQLARDIAFGRVPTVKHINPPHSDIASGNQNANNNGVDPALMHDFEKAEYMLRDQPVDGRHCGKCKVELKSGMRWWVCGQCSGECRDGIHPAFVRREEMWDVDVEKEGDGDARAARESQVPWWRRWLGK